MVEINSETAVDFEILLQHERIDRVDLVQDFRCL